VFLHLLEYGTLIEMSVEMYCRGYYCTFGKLQNFLRNSASVDVTRLAFSLYPHSNWDSIFANPDGFAIFCQWPTSSEHSFGLLQFTPESSIDADDCNPATGRVLALYGEKALL
jgi:hypothetical protein